MELIKALAVLLDTDCWIYALIENKHGVCHSVIIRMISDFEKNYLTFLWQE